MKTMSTTKIDAVVPMYVNHKSMFPIIQRFFDSIKTNYPDINLIVIDDASPVPHGFKFDFKNYVNSGFTHTVNMGLIKTTAPIILVLNDDLVIKKGDLDRFYDVEGLGIWSPRDTASDNTDSFGAIWGMTRATYELLGNLNEKYRNYFSDKDYYNRAKKAGVPIHKWNDICVEHAESATFKNEDKERLYKEDQKKYS